MQTNFCVPEYTKKRYHEDGMRVSFHQGFPEVQLGHSVQISTSTVRQTFISWINVMYLRLGQYLTMAEDFQRNIVQPKLS